MRRAAFDVPVAAGGVGVDVHASELLGEGVRGVGGREGGDGKAKEPEDGTGSGGVDGQCGEDCRGSSQGIG